MNNSLIVGIGVIAVIVIGGTLLYVYGPTGNGTVATSTPTTTTGTTPTGGTGGTVKQATKPSVATNASAYPSSSTAGVSGTVTPNGAQTTYWYEYGPTTSLGSNTTVQTIGSGYLAIPAPGYVSGLKATTQYYYRLGAQNRFGTVYGGLYSFITTNIAPPASGKAPSIRTDSATNVTRTGADVNGRVNPEGITTTSWFEYGESPDLGSNTAFVSAGTGSALANTSASLSGLKPATKYYFRLDAQNQFGTVAGPTLSFTTAGPAQSGIPAVETTAVGSIEKTSATFKGTVNPNGSTTTYWFEYSDTSLVGSVIGRTTPSASAGNGSSANAVSMNVTDLTKDTRYFVRLVASNANGTVYGGSVDFKTKN